MTLNTILADMELLEDWMDKYAYLIDLGRQLPAFPESARVADNKVAGCTSQVWLTHRWEDEKLMLEADSDAMIVKGLLGVLLAAYNEKTAEEIQKVDIETAFKTMQLDENLTPNRRNGFTAIVGKIRSLS